ncbi:hypothetical protein OG413_46830 [Streptomyces sp. NBC_01433]|uniref:hypothetical protein n=1 Tax=Streptomyces sp. NBC_01433 TaxID=2903864 RepID=UPI00224E5A8D|nr:hypothetical protein [Streptomyces sp. NBC_01433]MCX4682664.1 hypothetical protein [Streptomyces sp. NBC_01433]MCX4682704.1 hypothetical protein [Streptomyces sp. NBC_01433]
MTSASDVWRSPDGEHFRRSWNEEYDSPVVGLRPVVYDPDTGQWSSDQNALPVEVGADLFEATYMQVPLERLRDPRITRLTGLVHELLADYERSTGGPPADADAIRVALGDVAEIPEEARKHRHGAARSAARQGFHQGRRR